MTNMKDRLRTPRDTKVKFQIRTRSINVKAKEKLNARTPVALRVATRRSLKENIIPSVQKAKKEAVAKPGRKSTKDKLTENVAIKSTRRTRRNSVANGDSNSDVRNNNVKSSKGGNSEVKGGNSEVKGGNSEVKVNGSITHTSPGAKRGRGGRRKVEEQGKREEKPKRGYNRKKASGGEGEKEVVEGEDGKTWKKEFFTIPVNGKIECVYYKTAQANSIRKISDKPRHHKCSVCNKAFLGKNDLRKHSLIHYGLLPFQCSFCEKRFRQAGNLRNHIMSYHPNTVENPQEFICDYCGKRFLIKERLRLHLRVHTGYKPYQCPTCLMQFARNGQMRQHQRTHTGERNFQCDICKATFTYKAKLKMHVHRHYDIKNFTCHVCGKRFLRLDAYKKHLTCYHNDEKPFQCNICHKRLKGHLAEHMRTHNAERPHECEVCGSRFVQRSQLTVHHRIHSGARPYRCRVCWKAFAHSTALTLHTRHHTGEKPFPCRFCSTPFSQLSHLKKHMQILHGDARAYCHPACKEAFHTKMQLDKHLTQCTAQLEPAKEESAEERLSRRIAESFQPSEPQMALTKMRLLLAVLLKKICSKQKLQRLGFNKRLIDDILLEALLSSGRQPCQDPSLSPAQRLKLNVQQFLDWTVPQNFMLRFRDENKTTEQLLEELTS